MGRFVGTREKSWGSASPHQSHMAFSTRTGALYWFSDSVTISRYDPATGVLTSSWGTIPANTSRVGPVNCTTTLMVLAIVGGALKDYSWNLITTPEGGAGSLFTTHTYTGSALVTAGNLQTPSFTSGTGIAVFSDDTGRVWSIPSIGAAAHLVGTFGTATITDIIENSPIGATDSYFLFADSANNVVKKIDRDVGTVIETYAITNPRYLTYGPEEATDDFGPYGLVRVITSNGSQIQLKPGGTTLTETPILYSSTTGLAITPFSGTSELGYTFDWNRERWWAGSNSELWYWTRPDAANQSGVRITQRNDGINRSSPAIKSEGNYALAKHTPRVRQQFGH